MRCFPCRLVQLSRCNHITIFWGKGLTAMILDGFLRLVPSPNPLFLLFILVLWLYFCVLDSFSLRVSLKWGVGPMALDGSSLHNSQKVRRSISLSGHGATLFCRLRGPTCMLSGAAFGLSSCVTFCQVMEMIRLILCNDGMMKPSWHDIYNLTDVWKVSVSMYNCNIKLNLGPSPLPARNRTNSPCVRLFSIPTQCPSGCLGSICMRCFDRAIWGIPPCVTSEMMLGIWHIVFLWRMNTWNSNTFVVILVCAMNLHCGNHDLMIVAISNMFLMTKEMWDGLEGLEVFVTKKCHFFVATSHHSAASNRLNRSWWRVKLLICCGDVARCALGKPTTVMVGIIFWGKMVLWILVCF